MKQNGVVCYLGPALIFFIFRFEYLIPGPEKLLGLSRNGPQERNRLLWVPTSVSGFEDAL